MTIPHPYRYPAAFQSQLIRLERLAPGITSGNPHPTPYGMFFEIECTGVSDQQLEQQNLRLRHLEQLIANWRIDGEVRFNIGATGETDIGAFELPDLPPSVSYVEFDYDPRLRLDTIRGSRIEGVYIREVAADGMPCAELTFVCEEPGWRTMDTCIFAEAVQVGARISFGTVPLSQTIDLAHAAEFFDRDQTLHGEAALSHALSLTADFAASGLWNTRSPGP